MNRAMGFGILSGTMTGTMVASTALTPTPASAHSAFQISDFAESFVLYDSATHDHLAIFTVDRIDGDGVRASTQIKTSSAAVFTLTAPEGQEIQNEIQPDWAMFRKCLRMGSGPLACNDADWAPI
jgi:hypothetical protein